VTSTFYTDDVEELNKLENDPKVEVTSVRTAMGNSLLRIQHKPVENTAGRNGNIMLGSIHSFYSFQHI
jgi:hypothetical protein